MRLLQTQFIYLAVAAVTTLPNCAIKKKNTLEDYGVQITHLKVSPENLSILNSTIWAKRPVNARLDLGHEKLPVVLNYAGKSTLDSFKKSYQVQILDGKTFEGRSSFRLSSQAIDPTALRSQVGFSVYQEMGLLTPKISPTALYLNDNFQGLYQLIESVDEEFFAQRNQPISNLYKAKFSNATFHPSSSNNLDEGLTIRFGPAGYTDINFFISQLSKVPDPKALEALETILDIDNFITYTATTVLLKNWDGFINNYFIYRRKSDGKLAFAPWDLDRVYEPEPTRHPYLFDKSIWGHNEISRKILQIEPYRRRYLETLKKGFETFPIGRIEGLISEKVELQKEAFAADRVLAARGKSITQQGQIMKEVATAWHLQILAELNQKLSEY